MRLHTKTVLAPILLGNEDAGDSRVKLGANAKVNDIIIFSRYAFLQVGTPKIDWKRAIFFLSCQKMGFYIESSLKRSNILKSEVDIWHWYSWRLFILVSFFQVLLQAFSSIDGLGQTSSFIVFTLIPWACGPQKSTFSLSYYF